MIEHHGITHLTFDCYGTLIDWETGILDAVHPVLVRHGVRVPDARVLRLYATFEAKYEAGPYRPYRQILRSVMAAILAELGVVPEPEDADTLPDSVPSWPPFPDTADALRDLATRFKLVVISNVDDALFARTAEQLGVELDGVITAEQVGRYKPAPQVFLYALQKLGLDKRHVIHVAQSLYHDHAPARSLDIRSVRINRPSILAGTGLALPDDTRPELELPDLRSLAEALGLAPNRDTMSRTARQR